MRIPTVKRTVTTYLKEKIFRAIKLRRANYCPKNSNDLLKLSSINQKDNMKYGSFLLKLDVDTALDQAGILRNLSMLRAERLFEKVSRINDGLKLGREHSHRGQILGD